MAEWKETELGQMPADWDLKTVDEVKSIERKSIISGPFGSNISSKFFVSNGIPVIRGNNLSLDVGKRFIDDGFVFITQDKANELGTWAIKDDLIFTAAGTIGQVGILTGSETYPKYIISNKQLRVRLDRTIVEPLFAYYWFASPLMVNTINGRDTGSTIPLINLSVLKGLPIPLPPLPEQQAIAEVLRSLDNKIDLLHRQNKTLEALAETLFRKWFVEEAEDQNTELGKVADVTTGKGLKREEFDEAGQYPVLGANGEIGRTNNYLTEEKLILTGRVGTLGKVYISEKKVWISDNVLIVKPTNELLFYPIYFSLKRIDFENLNVGSTQPLVTQTDLKKIVLALPTDEKLKEFSRQCSIHFEKQAKNKQQILSLTELRDTLLPKLMSGEVSVAVD